MSKERQLRNKEETRKAILDVACSIISKEGIEGLSIRKITNSLDYSPAIIYHYFRDKNEIVETLMSEEYSRILASIKTVARNESAPEKEIKETFTKYIKRALAHPEAYKAIMLNDDRQILKKTSILREGISVDSPTFQTLCENIQRGIDQSRYANCDIELTAQIIWTSTFGLIIRLIIEKDIPEEQVNRLIEQHFNILFSGLMTRKAVEEALSEK